MKRVIYLICTTSRSGSTYLCELLRSTRRLGNPREFYNTRKHEESTRLWSAKDDLDYLRHLLKNTSTENGVCGVKLSTTAFMKFREGLGPIADALHIRYLFLRRRDRPRQAISLYRATQSRIWEWRRDEPMPAGKVHFDEKGIIEASEAIQRANQYWVDWFTEAQVSPLELWYEDIMNNAQNVVRSVCRWVGVDDQHLPPLSTNTRIMRDHITERWVQRIQSLEATNHI